jgi:SnoaL-like domain
VDIEMCRTIDRVAIGALLETYADVINRRAFDELDELFLPSCEIVIDARRGDPIVVSGGAGLGAFVGAAIDRFDFFEFVVLSKRLWVDGSDEAEGRLYMCELRHDRATGAASQAFGVYHDRFRRVDDRWWFASRRYHSLARTVAAGGRSLDVFEFPTIPRDGSTY